MAYEQAAVKGVLRCPQVFSMHRSLGLAFLAFGLCLLPSLSSADIYSYTDADGVIHFANKQGGGPYRLYLKSNERAGKHHVIGEPELSHR